MNEPRLKHIGADAILAERIKLLASYDAAKVQVVDDAVKVDHGHVAEELFRNYLDRFLPKKYGVAKGHIITRDLTYEGGLEEWDVIIYDALEAPVLYVRDGLGDTPKLGIPVQYVKAVLEVKATMNQANAKKVTTKLLKLGQFKRTDDVVDEDAGDCLPEGFFSKAIFFETATKDKTDYVNCLNKLQPLNVNKFAKFGGALILRSQNDPSASGAITSLAITKSDSGDSSNILSNKRFEVSEPIVVATPQKSVSTCQFTISVGFGVNIFSTEIMNLVSLLNDGLMGPATDLSGYGHVPDGVERKALWPSKT